MARCMATREADDICDWLRSMQQSLPIMSRTFVEGVFSVPRVSVQVRLKFDPAVWRQQLVGSNSVRFIQHEERSHRPVFMLQRGD
jgi:hypothetical protein